MTGASTGFTCLWCGTSHTPRSADDLEAWARLCPDCLGRADENQFLRFRLRQALDARARAAAGDLDAELLRYYEARAPEYDDWYLRRGRYERGPVHDQAFAAELDVAGRWLDSLPIRGDIVELAAGTGWWSPLLASKGTLSAYDAVGATLDKARERLIAHGLKAHLHVRDAWAAPEREVDVLFTGFWLSHIERERLGEFLSIARRWLRPGGRFAAIDSLPDPQSGAPDTEWIAEGVQRRRVSDGRTFNVRKVIHSPDELRVALIAVGFEAIEVSTTGRFFVLVTATA